MLTPLYTFLVLALVVGTVCIHALLASAVYLDGVHEQQLNRPLWFIGPGYWALVVLVYGLLGVFAYWLMHHSTLRPGRRPDALPPVPPLAGG